MEQRIALFPQLKPVHPNEVLRSHGPCDPQRGDAVILTIGVVCLKKGYQYAGENLNYRPLAGISSPPHWAGRMLGR